MLDREEVVRKEYNIIKKAFVVVLILCTLLLLFGDYAKDNGNLVEAFVLCVTSVVVVIVYYIGLRRFLRIFKENEE